MNRKQLPVTFVITLILMLVVPTFMMGCCHDGAAVDTNKPKCSVSDRAADDKTPCKHATTDKPKCKAHSEHSDCCKSGKHGDCMKDADVIIKKIKNGIKMTIKGKTEDAIAAIQACHEKKDGKDCCMAAHFTDHMDEIQVELKKISKGIKLMITASTEEVVKKIQEHFSKCSSKCTVKKT